MEVTCLLHLQMEQLVILSVIAIGYADKLDKTYLPPSNAASAGGSPGALTAPAIQSGPSFGQGLPSGLGFTPGPAGFTQGSSGFSQGSSGFGQRPVGFGQGPSGFGQGSADSEQPSSGFGSSNNGVPSGNGLVSPKGGARPGSSYDAAFETRIPSASSGFGSPQPGANQAGVGELAKGSFNQGFGQGAFGPNVVQAYTPERAQASADRSATILNYYNENNGDSYKYSYETSNGISAGEEGEATNGVRAKGGYSYTGDDGVAYSVTYTADENGYQPQGEHLPTPHPIPEEILKSIEENARAAAAGTQEGAYRPEEYESETPLRQYNAGATSFNQPQGPSVETVQGLKSTQGQAYNRPESNQYFGSQDKFAQSGISGQYGQESTGSSGQFNGKVSTGLGQAVQVQGQGGLVQGPSSQFRPQEQTGFSVGIGSVKLGLNNQGSSAPSANGLAGVSSYSGSQSQYQTGLGKSNVLSGNQADIGSISTQGQRTSLESTQGYQYTPGSQPFGPTGTSGQGNQYQLNANQNAFGVNGANQDNQNAGLSIGQGTQNQYRNKPSFGSNVGIAKTSPAAYNQNSQSLSSFGRGSQQNGNQAAFGSDKGSSLGAPQFGTGNQASGSGVSATASVRDSQPIQAPYQYNRPSQSFDSQPQRLDFNGSQGSNLSNQGNQGGSEQFGGPRQPPSFSPQEGYKY
ncbi:unnamed protein product [Euphydryas editha]|uniref:Uncharacterized protein n=1 Tax=Euphydryas editha TaxID=104508 RepID=A0AAU9TTL2_EUPED|nr:unnamed protein product [Euphydryas editha]